MTHLLQILSLSILISIITSQTILWTELMNTGSFSATDWVQIASSTPTASMSDSNCPAGNHCWMIYGQNSIPENAYIYTTIPTIGYRDIEIKFSLRPTNAINTDDKCIIEYNVDNSSNTNWQQIYWYDSDKTDVCNITISLPSVSWNNIGVGIKLLSMSNENVICSWSNLYLQGNIMDSSITYNPTSFTNVQPTPFPSQYPETTLTPPNETNNIFENNLGIVILIGIGIILVLTICIGGILIRRKLQKQIKTMQRTIETSNLAAPGSRGASPIPFKHIGSVSSAQPISPTLNQSQSRNIPLSRSVSGKNNARGILALNRIKSSPQLLIIDKKSKNNSKSKRVVSNSLPNINGLNDINSNNVNISKSIPNSRMSMTPTIDQSVVYTNNPIALAKSIPIGIVNHNDQNIGNMIVIDDNINDITINNNTCMAIDDNTTGITIDMNHIEINDNYDNNHGIDEMIDAMEEREEQQQQQKDKDKDSNIALYGSNSNISLNSNVAMHGSLRSMPVQKHSIAFSNRAFYGDHDPSISANVNHPINNYNIEPVEYINKLDDYDNNMDDINMKIDILLAKKDKDKQHKKHKKKLKKKAKKKLKKKKKKDKYGDIDGLKEGEGYDDNTNNTNIVHDYKPHNDILRSQ